jgi:hypothetical protein
MADITMNEPSLRVTAPIKLIDLGDGTYANYHMQSGNKSVNITGAATTTVKTGAGILRRIAFNKFVALGVATIYDNTAGSGTVLATITLPAALLSSNGSIEYNLNFATGLTIVTSVAFDMTVVYW